MKNIHILPTEKPSRIYLIKSNNKLGITSNNPEFTENFGGGTQNQNIYITSNEEIKVGDWVIEFQKGDDIGEVHFINSEYVIARDIQKKIILTTDELYIHNDLIPKEYNTFPQYIQKIDYEFLEWFVKNPGCDMVEVSYGLLKPFQSNYAGYIIHLPDNGGVVEPNPFELPKALPDDVFFKSLEEPKQETPKEKAKELVAKFTQYTPADEDIEYEYAKQCALIAVDEIIIALNFHQWQNTKQIDYYIEVRQEIENL
jgi:hypothetical protein